MATIVPFTRVSFKMFVLEPDQKKEGKDKSSDKTALAVPRLSVCADVAKVDRARLCQAEVRVREVPSTTELRQTTVGTLLKASFQIMHEFKFESTFAHFFFHLSIFH